MTALTAFLVARIAEDEALARASVPIGGRRAGKTFWQRWVVECEAKRRIVARIQMSQMLPVQISDHAAECLLRALALPYADHPDYDPAWSAE